MQIDPLLVGGLAVAFTGFKLRTVVFDLDATDVWSHATKWLVPAVLAIGAGFEVYEFVFKAFWHHWSLGFYVADTVIDLVVNTSGAVAFAAATAAYRSRVGAVAEGAIDERDAERVTDTD